MKVKLGRYPKGQAKRRVSIEVENFDTWSLDHTLALIILPALIQLKHTKHGVPSTFVSDISDNWNGQVCFDFINDDKGEVFDIGVAAWEEAIDKMIWSFQQIAIDDNYDSKYHHGKMDLGWKLSSHTLPNQITGVMEPTYEMVDKNPTEHWYDHVGHTLHNERIQEGLDLFGKHLRDLWD